MLGHMGRDVALAENLVANGHTLDAMGEWANPGVAELAEQSGGLFVPIDKVTNAAAFAAFAVGRGADMAVTNFDDALPADTRGAIERRLPKGQEMLLPFPGREAAKVEWDKFYLREVLEELGLERYNPEGGRAVTVEEADALIASFETRGIEVVVKPRNLTGGKGVKVQGEGKHLQDYDAVRAYAREVLALPSQTGLEIQKRLEGHEFTLQIFTDGKTSIRPPATYDYPYRNDGDTGPGTGGMGTFSQEDGLMPFISQAEYDEAFGLIEKILEYMQAQGLGYKGMIYPTFFKTPEGLKLVEINARGGDPEMINVLDLLTDNVDMGEVLALIARGELAGDSVKYQRLASAMAYLVAPGYGDPGRKGDEPIQFAIDHAAVAASDAKLRYAAAERVDGNLYRSTAISRVVGLSALGATAPAARQKIELAIASGLRPYPLPLEYRRDVADEAYIRSLGSPRP